MPRSSQKAVHLAEIDALYLERLLDYVNADDERTEEDALEQVYLLLACYEEASRRRYGASRASNPIKKSLHWANNILPTYDEVRFRCHARCSRQGFHFVLSKISNSIHFQSKSTSKPQQPVSIQLLNALNRLGTNGNGSSFLRLAGQFGTSDGNIFKQTERVINALFDLRDTWIVWGDAAAQEEESRSNYERQGFVGCLGKVDGTCVELAFKPGS